MSENLIGKRINVLDKGWIELVDMMPHPDTDVSGDLAIVNAARVSFLGESKGSERDKKLLFYLLRNHHTSPFEMVEFKFRVRAPLVTWWQWVRHRTWNMNAQCLDGDTEIIFNKPQAVHIGQHQVGSKITLAELHQRWQEPHKRKRVKEMYLRSVNENTMLLDSAHIGNIVDAGTKDGFKVIMEDGKEIICSADHRFLFEDGWKTLKEATGLELVNERAVYNPDLPSLYMNGKPLTTRHLYDNYDWLKYQYDTRQSSIKQMAELAQCSTHTIRKYLNVHGLTSQEFTDHILENRDLPFDITFTIPDKMDRYASLKLTNSHATPHLVRVQQIEYVGKREMYDIVVDGNYPNFVANWFVVHNSGRYTPFEENDFYVPDVWRKQSKDNKQASEGEVGPAINDELTEKLIQHYDEGFKLYSEALEKGVSKEIARLFLPGFSVYYTWVTKIDAHNLMRFLRLRMANDAQYEIRVYANAIYEHIFKPALPWTAEAFEKYSLNPKP